MTDTPGRLLTLLSLLQTPREWPGSELAERLQVSPRTIRRDIDRLRELGYPVEATRGPEGGYRLTAGAAMPPLLLDDEEAVAIAVGLRTAAGHAVEGIEEASVRALAKLIQVLPSRLRHRVAALNAATVPVLPGDGPRIDPEDLAVIAAAVAARERLRFDYRAGDGAETRRQVEPHRLVSYGRRWYLVCYDPDRTDWRIFRVDRLSHPQRTGLRFDPRELPAGDAAAYVADKLAGRTTVHRAVVTLHAPYERLAARLGTAAGQLEEIDEHRCRLVSRADSVEWLGARLAMVGCEFEVHEPPELVAYLHELAGRVGRSVEAARGR
ncbi:MULTISPECIES: helix-turn-helix transcriptional regulator [Kitasatospora]|uniref:DNA-binding transcriptional regulator YafY n=2 Tax=Kitasatospora TaxID=2063 RepID=A0ABT1IQS1_9ACTN|nr:YafY family protein [Kitasatospora paracochleata]MCP2306956.1 putative DNA-binding transcriptional regulator YafY [Kitasatospora paracochleata]